MTVGYSLIETNQDLNAFIDGQHYEACKWAVGFNPSVKLCFDCPFPVCVDLDIIATNQAAKPKYIELVMGRRIK